MEIYAAECKNRNKKQQKQQQHKRTHTAACWPTCSACRNDANDRSENKLAAAIFPSTEKKKPHCGSDDGSGASDEAVRESGVFTVPGGPWGPGREVGGLARPTCSNSRSYPEEMKTSISAEPHGSDTPDPPHFLAGSAAIFCFHSWGPGATATATAEPPAAYLHIATPAEAQDSNPVTHSGGKLKVLNVSVFLPRIC